MMATKAKQTASPAQAAKPECRTGAHRYQTVPLTQPLKWADWIAHLWQNSPSRFYDRDELNAWVADYWDRNPRLEAAQWRRAGIRSARQAGPQVPAAEQPPEAVSEVEDGSVDDEQQQPV